MYDFQKVVVSSNYSSSPKIKDSFTNGSIGRLIGREMTKSPVLSYFGPRTSYSNYDTFEPHEYEMYEYSRILDTEAIVAKAFERKKALMFKNGYLLSSENDENVSYIKQRLKEFHYVSGISFEEFVEELSYNMIMFHNCYILMYRNADKSTGKPVPYKSSMIDPVAALFNLPTESIKRKLREDGSVEKYKQEIGTGKYRIFSSKLVKHLSYNKRSGFTIATPPLESVKDDIIALRRIEESVETLIYKSLFPIIHVKVGTEQKPAEQKRDGTSEVDEALAVFRDIDDSGGVVTSERIEIKSIGAESMALRVESYLEYFKNRVMIGLGVSTTDLGIGDSSGKSTGAIISQTLKETVIDMQRVISRFITEEVFADILVESGKYKAKYLIPEEDMVKLIFNSVDHDSQIKIESHWLNLVNSKVITPAEFRILIGRRPMNDDEMKSIGDWEEKTANPKEMESMQASIDGAKASAEASVITAKSNASNKAATAKSTSTSGSKQNKKSGASNSSKSKTSPKNQYKDSIQEDVISLLDSILSNSDNEEEVKRIISSNMKCTIDIVNIYDNLVIDNISASKAKLLCGVGLSKMDNPYDYILNELTEAYLSTGLL